VHDLHHGACVTGVIVAGSIAGHILLAPALIAAIVIDRSRASPGGQNRSVALFVIAFLALAGALASSPFVMSAGGSWEANTSLEGGHLSRQQVFANTIEGVKEQAIVGAGLGAFEQVYPRYEDPNVVSTRFANHAHNDYLEFVFETGVVGILLIGGMLVWWAGQAARIWSGPINEEGRLRRAATIATAVLLLHSLADYPLRTTASAAVAALCLAAMVAVRRGPKRAGADEDASAARNIEI